MLATVLLRDKPPGIAVHLFNKQTVAGDLSLDVTVGRAGDCHADRTGCAMARQSDNPDVVGEIFPAELGTDAEFVSFLQEFLLQFDVAKCLAMLVPFGRQLIKIFGTG